MSSNPLLPTVANTATANDSGLCFNVQPPSHPLSCIFGRRAPIQVRVAYHDILWSSGDNGLQKISYIEHEKNGEVHVAHATVEVPAGCDVMARAYPHSQPAPRVLVVVNTAGGVGKARDRYHKQIMPVFLAAHCSVTYLETTHAGHAVEIGRELEVDRYDIIACCLGDGVPHEIINGMYERPDRATAFARVAVTQLPCGLGNALLLSTHGTPHAGEAALLMLKLARARMDLMAVTQGEDTRLSFLSQTYGVIADLDIGTEHLRWLGPLRFDLGVVLRFWRGTLYPCDLWVKYAAQGEDVERHYRQQRLLCPGGLSPEEAVAPPAIEDQRFCPTAPGLQSPPPADWAKVSGDDLSIFYVGQMPYMLTGVQFFPAALPRDGLMDMVITSTHASLFRMLRVLFDVANGTHVDAPEVTHAKIAAYRLAPRVDLRKHYLSVDGESFPLEPLQVEVLPGLLTTLMPNGQFVDSRYV